MIEPHVGKVKTDLITDGFTVIIPLRNKEIAIVKISFCWNILIIKYLIN